MGTRVYVGRIPRRCSRRDVEKFFRGYGRMRDIVLMATYGFVEFESSRDAEDAVYDLNGKDLLGERVVIEHAKLPPKDDRRRGRERVRQMGSRYGPPVRTEYRVIVENLSSRISWQDLKDLMRKAGDVTFADAHNARRNEGVVEFSSYSDLRAAIDRYDGYELYGRKLKVYEDRARSHSRSRSRSYRSRSYSRSRSRSRSHSRSRRSRRRRRHSSSRSRSRSDRSRSDRSRSRSRSEKKRKHRHRSRSRSQSRDEDREKDDRRSVSRSRSRTPSPGGRKSRSADRMSDHRENGDNASLHSKHASSPARSKSRSPSPDRGNDDSKDEKRDDEDHYSDRRSRSRSRSNLSRSRSRSRSKSNEKRDDEEMDGTSD